MRRHGGKQVLDCFLGLLDENLVFSVLVELQVKVVLDVSLLFDLDHIKVKTINITLSLLFLLEVRSYFANTFSYSFENSSCCSFALLASYAFNQAI